MLRHLVLAIALAVVTIAAPAWATEKEGTVRTVDSTERTITLDDGTKLWLSEGIAADALKEGDVVKVDYEERDGKSVATSIEVK